MSAHIVSIEWHRAPHETEPNTYGRRHLPHLNGRQSLWVSASADYKGEADCADPEQLLVNAVSSCHMLFFLAIAELQGFTVEEYRDRATGYLQTQDGGMAVTRIELAPQVRFGGVKQPDDFAMKRMHAGAHRNCFIARSLKASVTILDDAARLAPPGSVTNELFMSRPLSAFARAALMFALGNPPDRFARQLACGTNTFFAPKGKEDACQAPFAPLSQGPARMGVIFRTNCLRAVQGVATV